MMTINGLIRELNRAKPDFRVYFSFCNCVPTKIQSWRGIYDDPAIGWQPSGYSGHVEEYPTVSSLISELEKAKDGRLYEGWKGGDYSYNGDEILHVDNPGDYTNTEITHIEIKDFEVIIHTQKED